MNTEPENLFVPGSFLVPTLFETNAFRLRPLTVNDLVKDYDAVMSSANHIKARWPETSWPSGLTIEQNLIDLGWHQKEFQKRRSFAYTVVELDESRVIGCVYINPSPNAAYDAEVFFWTRPPEQVSFVSEAILGRAVNNWLNDVWPFTTLRFPGTTLASDK